MYIYPLLWYYHPKDEKNYKEERFMVPKPSVDDAPVAIISVIILKYIYCNYYRMAMGWSRHNVLPLLFCRDCHMDC